MAPPSPTSPFVLSSLSFDVTIIKCGRAVITLEIAENALYNGARSRLRRPPSSRRVVAFLWPDSLILLPLLSSHLLVFSAAMSFAGAGCGLQTRRRVALAAVRFGLCGVFSPPLLSLQMSEWHFITDFEFAPSVFNETATCRGTDPDSSIPPKLL